MVLEIGGEVGALVVLTSADLESKEIEIRHCGSTWEGTHVAVRSRPTVGTPSPIYAAVFGQLTEGRYELRLRPVERNGSTQEVEVIGGGLAELTWSC